MTDLYSENIANTILFAPANEGANKLLILSAHATPSMCSWLFKTFEERKLGSINVELIVTSTLSEGIDSNTHEGFKELQGNRSVASLPFVCSYLCELPQIERNLYIWLNDDTPIKAFECSCEFTQKSILKKSECSVAEISPKKAIRVFEKVEKRTVFCNYSEVEESVLIRSSNAVPSDCSRRKDNDCVTLSLLSKSGDVGKRSGLNWGQRNKRNKNEAYIPLSSRVSKKGFFPLNNQHFLVVTDDHHALQLRVEQQNNKAITTPESNALLGEYFRNRLDLPNGAFVSVQDLKKYGRTDVTFIKIDDEQFYMDFSPRKDKNNGEL